MIDCIEVKRLLMEYRDGALDDAGTETLRLHLHRCPGCLDVMNDYQSTVALLERLRPVCMPEGLLERLRRGCTRALEEAGPDDAERQP